MSSSRDQWRPVETSEISKEASIVIPASPARVRSFGSVIDVNTAVPRPLIRLLASSIGRHQMKSMFTMNKDVASGVDASNKTSKDVLRQEPELSKSIIPPAKRKFSDENCESSLSEDSHQHQAKRLFTRKPALSLTTSKALSPKKTLSTVQKEPLTGSSQTTEPLVEPLISSKKLPRSTLPYSKEQQLKWMTEADGNNDPDYFAVLIEQRFKALQETWAENDRLTAEIEQLEQEREALSPMFQKVIELKEMLSADDNESS